MLKVEVKVPEIKELDTFRALRDACLLVEEEAKKRAPVDTGTLRRSITTELHKDYGEVGTNLHYAPYVEFGTGLFASNHDGRQTPWSYQSADGEWHTTRGMSPQPFLYPALEDSRKKIAEIFREALERSL